MSEKDLSKALLRLGGTELINMRDAHEQIQAVLTRDRRRVRILAVIVGVFWLGSAVVLYGSMAKLIGLIFEVRHAGTQAADPLIAAVYKFLLALSGSVEALMLAVLGTVILVFASRRASLRQINASLIEISRKLDRLEQPS
jgi:hypothetical protein